MEKIVRVVAYGGMLMLAVLLGGCASAPSFVKARGTSRQDACVKNMRMVDSAKEQWALDQRKVKGDAVDINQVNTYVNKAGLTPTCPSGGKYEYKRIGEDPECSVHGTLRKALLVVASTGCRTNSHTTMVKSDDLVGWYKLPNRHYRTREITPGPGTLIPVFKRTGIYYSVCRGMEVPLKACPEGLEWGLLPSSMKGTKIGLDGASHEPYIIIEDAAAQYEGDYSTSGEKQFMTKIDKPSWLLDPTTRPPRTNEDFIGYYLPVWFSVYRWVVIKNGDKYRLEAQIAGKDGWKSEDRETADLVPLPDRLGFTWGGKKGNCIVYNRDCNRFEYVLGEDGPRMPLVRVDASLPVGTGAVSSPVGIGIPSWH